jgi:hypothetical protein
MKRSDGRILTSHVGSLPRPLDLLSPLAAKDAGERYDEPDIDAKVRRAVAATVARQGNAPTKTLKDAMEHEVVVGASGAGGGSVVGSRIYNAVLGTKFELIYGYEGGTAIDLAMRRGEARSRGAATTPGPATRRPCRTRSATACSTC